MTVSRGYKADRENTYIPEVCMTQQFSLNDNGLRYFQHARFIPIEWVWEREANINWSMVICQGSTRSELSRAYAFGREMVCSQKSDRNRNFFENAGHVSFSFCQTGSAETHTKPCKISPRGTSIKRPAIYWDHAVSWGGGVWVSVSDIGRVGIK